jgi:hypothetical protein
MKGSFIIHTAFYEPIKSLSDKQLGRIFRALFDYRLENEVQVEDDIRMAFMFFKNQMDIDEQKYLDKVEKNKQNGSKGGAAKGNNNARKKTTERLRNNRTLEKTTETSLYDNDNDNNNNNDLNSVESFNKDSMSNCKQPDYASSSKIEHVSIDFEKLICWFNETTQGVFGVIKYPISEKRKKLLRSRISEHGKESFMEVVNNAVKSDFLRGQNSRSWTATFDWIIKPTNYEKILSNNFKNSENGTNKRTQTASTQRPTSDEISSAIEIGIALAEADKNRQ